MTALIAEPVADVRQPHSTLTLSCRILSLLDLTEADDLLIPAAGRGAPIRPILEGRYVTPRTTVLIENGESNYNRLSARLDEFSDAPILAVHGNFLHMRDVYRPSKIAMIPPLARFQDVDYIMHAYNILKPGGRLVAICSDASLRHGSVVCSAFRHSLDAAGAEILSVPQKSFCDSDEDAMLIVMTKQ